MSSGWSAHAHRHTHTHAQAYTHVHTHIHSYSLYFALYGHWLVFDWVTSKTRLIEVSVYLWGHLGTARKDIIGIELSGVWVHPSICWLPWCKRIWRKALSAPEWSHFFPCHPLLASDSWFFSPLLSERSQLVDQRQPGIKRFLNPGGHRWLLYGCHHASKMNILDCTANDMDIVWNPWEKEKERRSVGPWPFKEGQKIKYKI